MHPKKNQLTALFAIRLLLAVTIAVCINCSLLAEQHDPPTGKSNSPCLTNESCLIDSLFQIYVSDSGLSSEGAYNHVAEVLSRQRPAIARQAARKALSLARDNQSLPEQISATFFLGVSYLENNLLDSALTFLNRGYTQSQAGKDSSRTGYFTFYLGLVYSKLGEYPLALESFRKAQEEFRATGNEIMEMKVVSQGFAILASEQGDLSKSEELFNKTYAFANENKIPGWAAVTLHNIGYMYWVNGKLKEADYYLKKHLRYRKTHNIKDAKVASDYVLLADIQLKQGNPDSAWYWAREGENAISGRTEVWHIRYFSEIKARIAIVQNWPDSLNKYTATGLRIRSQRLWLETVPSLLKMRGEYFEKQNQADSALYYLKKYRQISDSIRIEEEKRNKRNIELAMDLGAQKETIRFLNQENASQAKTVASRTFIAISLAVAGLLILVISILVTRRYRKQLEHNKALVKAQIKAMEIKALEQQALQENKPVSPKASEASTEQKQPETGSGTKVLETKSAPAPRDPAKEQNPEKYAALIPLLQEKMEKAKVYRDPGLSLPGLATQLNSNTRYVSAAIKAYFGKNVNEYINGYRISEARKLLADPSNNHLKIEAIGLEAGFSSKSTFNNAFKKLTGVTPSFFRKTAQKPTNQST